MESILHDDPDVQYRLFRKSTGAESRHIILYRLRTPLDTRCDVRYRYLILRRTLSVDN